MKRNRIFAVVLAVSLSLTLLVHPSLAFTYPSGMYDVDDILGYGYTVPGNESRQYHHDLIESVLTSLDSNIYIFLYKYDYTIEGVVQEGFSISYVAVEHGECCFVNREYYFSEPNVRWVSGNFGTSSYNYSSVLRSSTYSPFSIGDVHYYGNGGGYQIMQSNYNLGECYASSSFYTSSTSSLGPWTLISPKNLDISAYYPDQRILTCTKEVKYPFSSNPLEYIHISVDDNPVGSFVAFTFEDYNGDTRTVTVFSDSYVDVTDIEGTGVYWSFNIQPFLLSGYEFSLTQVTFWSGGSWGTKTIDVDLSFYEGERYPLATNWNNIYYVTEFAESQDNGSVVYGLTTLYLSYQYEGMFYYYDYEWSSCQPFTIKVLFMPDFMNNPFGSNNIDWLYQIYEQYDLIFFGINESTFNVIFSSYAPNFTYDNLYNIWFQSEEDAIETLTKREPRFINSNKSVKNDLSAQYYQADVGVIYTRSFLLKRMCSSLGDLDDRLLEFETGLIGQDGVLSGIQMKLNNIYKGQNDFFNGINDFVLKWDYWLDNYDVSDKLDSIVFRLDSILTFLEGDLSIDLDGLEHPWIDFYNFIKRVFDGAQRYLGNFTSSATAILDGSDMTRLPVPSISVEPALPFNPTLTPIPIPSFIPVPTLSGGG